MFTFFPTNEVSNILLFTVFDAFSLTSNESIEFKFRDNLRAPVDAKDLPGLILQKKCSGSFFIELVLDEKQIPAKAEVNYCLLLTFVCFD